MKMVNSLVSGAARMLSGRDLADSLSGTTRAFEGFCASLEKNSLRAGLRVRGLGNRTPVNAGSLPDAVWVALSRKHPHLRHYPLGEIAERALKKTVADLLPQSDQTDPAGLTMIADENLIEVFLRSSLKAMDRGARLELLLSNYFFEMAIDYLRRPSGQMDEDWGYEYHFSRAGCAVSTTAEHRFRQVLAAQCAESAESFLPFLLTSLAESSTVIDNKITVGLAKVFGARPGKSANEVATARKPLVNVVAGSRSAAELRKSFTVLERVPKAPRKTARKTARKAVRKTESEDDLMRLVLDGKRPNVTCKFSVLEAFLGRPLHSLTRDFLEIGAAVYITDIHCKRASNLKRRVGLVMPVRHLDVWSNAAPLLERAVSELGRDDFAIHFQKRKLTAERIKPLNAKSSDRCVCLFSGGIDSLAGVVWALDKGLKPVLVSHFANNVMSGIQNSLAAAIEAAYGLKPGTYAPVDGQQEASPDRVHIFVNEKKGKKAPYALPPRADSIMAEYLRSFLFLSIACAVAVESGINTVYVFENGPVALNPLLSEGTVTTRTAHPHFLSNFRELVKAVFGEGLCIENPFRYKTKGEITRMLAKPMLEGLVKKSNSCWNWFIVPAHAKRKGFKGRHDGLCLPCILRRTSVYAAGLWDKDAKYLVNVFKGYPNLSRNTIVAIADLLRFCKNVTTLNGPELLSFAPDLSVYDEHTDSGLMVEMYRRHAHEVIECFRNRSNAQLRQAMKALL